MSEMTGVISTKNLGTATDSTGTADTTSSAEKISFDTISNLYLSAMATNQSSATKGGGYPDLSVIAGLYSAADADKSGDINSETELNNLLNAIEAATGGLDLFEFSDDGTMNIGKNEHGTGETAATEKRGIDEKGVLLNTSCPVTGNKNCTCKVTDGFASVTDLFNALANDKDAGTMSDKQFSNSEETTLLDGYKSVLGKDLDFGLTFEDNKEVTSEEQQALELLKTIKSAGDIANLPPEQQTIIQEYLGALSPEVRDAKLIAIYGTLENAKTALGKLLTKESSTSTTTATSQAA